MWIDAETSTSINKSMGFGVDANSPLTRRVTLDRFPEVSGPQFLHLHTQVKPAL